MESVTINRLALSGTRPDCLCWSYRLGDVSVIYTMVIFPSRVRWRSHAIRHAHARHRHINLDVIVALETRENPSARQCFKNVKFFLLQEKSYITSGSRDWLSPPVPAGACYIIHGPSTEQYTDSSSSSDGSRLYYSLAVGTIAVSFDTVFLLFISAGWDELPHHPATTVAMITNQAIITDGRTSLDYSHNYLESLPRWTSVPSS